MIGLQPPDSLELPERNQMWQLIQQRVAVVVLLLAGCGVNTDDVSSDALKEDADARQQAAEREKAVTDVLEEAGFTITYDFLDSPSSQPAPEIQQQIDARGPNHVGDPFYIAHSGVLTHLHLLERLPSLHTVDFDNSNVTDDDLQYLRNLPNLRILFLNHTTIRGPGLEHLSGSRIEALHLKGAQLESSAVAHLQRLSSLRTLVIYNNHRITAEDRLKLKAALPLCDIP